MSKIDPEILAAIESDPFAADGGDEPSTEPAAEPAQAEATASAQAEQTDASEPESVDKAEPVASQEAAEDTSVEGQSDLLSVVQTLLAAQQADASQQKEPETSNVDSKQPEVPTYEFDIKDELVEGLNSSDPQTQKLALGALVKGIAQAIHSQMENSFSSRIESLPNTVEERIQQYYAQQQVVQDFYSTHSDLDRPELKVVVGLAAKAMQQELAAQGKTAKWTPEFRDKLAARVRAIAGTKAKGAKAQPPHVFQAGTRPAAPKQSGDAARAEEIAKVLGDW